MIFDHTNKFIYAGISKRATSAMLHAYAEYIKYSLIEFETKSSKGEPFYHTNIILSIGLDFAVVCYDAIAHYKDREIVK